MDYKLPKRALFVSLLVSLLFPLLIFLVLSPLVQRAIVDESTEEADRVADFMVRHLDLTPESFTSGFPEGSAASEIDFISSSFDLQRICLIAADGRFIYCSDGEWRGRALKRELIDQVLVKGNRNASFTEAGKRTADGDVSLESVIETHVPVKANGRVVGAIEVYYIITGVHENIIRIKTLFAALLFVLSFVMLVMISYYMVRTGRIERRRHEAEDELLQEQIKAETVFSSMGDNIIIQDKEYRVIYQNAVNRDVYGDKRGQLCYEVYEGLDHICPDCPVELTYQDGGIHRTEKEVMTPNGNISFELTSSPLRNPAGEIVAGIKVVRDISNRRRLEDQLRHAQKMEAIGTLTSGISHEFNNILTSIIGFSELLLETEKGGTAQKYLKAIFNSGKKAEVLTKGLLAYSRKQIAYRGPVSLNELVRDLMPILENITGVSIGIRLDLSEGELVVTADRNQIEQVLINIVTNARDAIGSDGEILIRTAPLVADQEFISSHGFGREGERMCMMSVRDNGEGMDSETMEKIFEPFFTTKDVGKGTGLGLSIAYGIVAQHGGLLDVSSTPGQGTEFRVYLK